MNKKEKELAEDFNEFMSQDISQAPRHVVSEKIRHEVMNELKPSWSSVMLRLLFIHLVMSSLTLALCPQFGIGPIGGGQGLMGFVESYGHLACGAFCGGFFFSGSVLMSALIFSPAQKRKVTNSAFGSFSILALISLGTLISFSSMIKGVTPHLHLQFIAAWLFTGIGFSILLSKLTMKSNYNLMRPLV